jgi:hypothetical protein
MIYEEKLTFKKTKWNPKKKKKKKMKPTNNQVKSTTYVEGSSLETSMGIVPAVNFGRQHKLQQTRPQDPTNRYTGK